MVGFVIREALHCHRREHLCPAVHVRDLAHLTFLAYYYCQRGQQHLYWIDVTDIIVGLCEHDGKA